MKKPLFTFFLLVLMIAAAFPAYAEKGKIGDCIAKYKGMPEGIVCCYEHHQNAIEKCQQRCQETKCSFNACERTSFDIDCGPVIRH